MAETTQQYISRILSYLEGKKPVSVLAATPKRLTKLLKKAPPSKLRRRPTPDKWSVAEILAHLADSEVVYGLRLRLVFAQNGVPIQGTDQNVWAEIFRYGKANPKEALATFVSLRSWNLRMLRLTPMELWKNSGVHTERGEESVERMLEMFAGHDINHMKQIEAILRGKQKV